MIQSVTRETWQCQLASRGRVWCLKEVKKVWKEVKKECIVPRGGNGFLVRVFFKLISVLT